jgi:hypothetical protein
MVDPGTFVLYDSVRPALDDGDYALEIQQSIADTSGAVTIPPVPPQSFSFRVAGPRFALPPDQLLSRFPPPDGEGDYSSRLPQVVLQRRTLPYERRILTTDDSSTTPPWLALVVLAQGEGQLITNQPIDTTGLVDPTDQDASVRDVLRVSSTVVESVFPTLDDLPWLTHVRQVDMSDTELALDADGWTSVVIANRLPIAGPAASAEGAPTPLSYGAFLVSLEGHAGDLPTAPPPATSVSKLRVYDDATVEAAVAQAAALQRLPLGTSYSYPASGHAAPSASAGAVPQASASFGAASAAMTGRTDGATLPSTPADAWSAAPPARNQTAVAASARAGLPLVTGAASMAGFAIAPELLEPAATILEFTVLAHWSFTSQPDGDFRYLMQHLDVGMLGTLPPSPPSPAPGAGPPAPDHLAPLEALDTGHIAVSGSDRGGDTVMSWYRGPFTPRELARPDATTAAGALAHAADQLRRAGSDGREDVSLAVAFELGRALAAAQPGVIAALLGWRQENYDEARLATLLALGGTPLHQQLSAVLAMHLPAFSAGVSAGILSTLGANGAAAVGPVRPLVEPPVVSGAAVSLAATIAAGFGLDPATVDSVLGSPTVPATGGLPSTATTPQAPQELAELQDASFTSVARRLTITTATLSGAATSPVQFAPPLLRVPTGLAAPPVAQAPSSAETAPSSRPASESEETEQ